MDARQGIGKEIEEQIIPVELEIVGDQDLRLKRREALANVYSNVMEEPIAHWMIKKDVQSSVSCILALSPLVVILLYCMARRLWK
ncbi:hypothetical protein [Roseofilum capinflatum]|uniref:Uncharacterized protein n=1 Tax=Roseofilum capinflatum BLCC-M114 TaxID=3022440 RepID=A0ABT7B6Q4_9CYAN|nr:hypothetical protein [Roseofilum capinflatum]MDJ1174821.1 hypothetical protein [Roseofilum capinflatum BLCC-M114]